MNGGTRRRSRSKLSLCGSSFLLGLAGAGNTSGVGGRLEESFVGGVGVGAEAEVEIGVKVEVEVVVRMVGVVTDEDAFGEVGREVLDDASGVVVVVAVVEAAIVVGTAIVVEAAIVVEVIVAIEVIVLVANSVVWVVKVVVVVVVVVVGEVVEVVGMLRIDKALSDFGGVVRGAVLVTWAVVGLVLVVITVATIGVVEVVVSSIRVASWGIGVVFRVEIEIVKVVVN